MPSRPPRACPRCGSVVAGVCAACRRGDDRARGTARQRGYDSRWERESAAFLAALGHPRCACGCGRAADMVDHIVPHRGDPRLFWDKSNWQPYAGRCNARKAATTDRCHPR